MTLHDAPGYDPRRSALIAESDAQATLPVSRATLFRLRKRGELGYVRVGRRVFYREDDIAEYIERNRAVAAP